MTRPLLLSLVLASACLHDTTPNPVVAAPLPTAYSAGDAEPAPEREPSVERRADAGWWLQYDDVTLHALVDRALRNNYTLRQRFAAIQQAEALRRQASGLRWPTVNGLATLSRSRSVGFFGANTSDRLDASLPISYEVDLFARRAGDARAARDEVRASELDMEAAAISLSAEVAEAWYDVVDARAELVTLTQQRETNETYLELTQLRFQQGLASAVDVHQQRQQTAASRARLELTPGPLAVAGPPLALLLGEPPGSVDVASLGPEMVAMPELGATPDPGVPGTLVQNRPDVLAARRRVEAADRRIGGLVSARLPTLTVQFSPGWQWFRTDADLTQNTARGFTYTAGATLNVPASRPLRVAVDAADRYFLETAVNAFAQSGGLMTLVESGQPADLTLARGVAPQTDIAPNLRVIFAPEMPEAAGGAVASVGPQLTAEVLPRVLLPQHPVLRHLPAESLAFAGAREVTPAPGSAVLVADLTGTALIWQHRDPDSGVATLVINLDPAAADFVLSPFFPVLIHAAATHLGGRATPPRATYATADRAAVPGLGPGQSTQLQTPDAQTLTVAAGDRVRLDQAGVYRGDRDDQSLAVSVLHPAETQLASSLPDESADVTLPAGHPPWLWLTLLALAIVIAEEVLYHRRKVG